MSPSTRQPDVGDPVLQQRDPVDPQAEREARVPLGVVAAVLQDDRDAPCRSRAARSTRSRTRGSRPRRTRMHVTASSAPGSTNGKNAGPSFVSRSSPNSALATASSVPFRSANVIPSSTTSPSTWWNTGRVGRVGRLAPVHTAGRDDVDGWRLRLHRPDLDGGGLGAQQELGMAGDVDVDRVLHRARGVIRRDVQRFEVVPLVLDLRALRRPGIPGAGRCRRSRLPPARADAAIPGGVAGRAARDPLGPRRAGRPRRRLLEHRRAAHRPPLAVRPRSSLTRWPTSLPGLRGQRPRARAAPRTAAPSARRPRSARPPARSSVVAASNVREAALELLVEYPQHLLGVHGVRRVYGVGGSETDDRKLDVQRQPAVRGLAPRTAALRLRDASRDVQTDLGTSPRARLAAPRTARRRRAEPPASRDAETSSRPSRTSLRTAIGPSLPHHTSASMNASSVVFSRPPSSSTLASSPPDHPTVGCSGSRRLLLADLTDEVGDVDELGEGLEASRSSPGPRRRAAG